MSMNLKKVSIFIDTSLRKRLTEPDSELLAKAFGHATLFAPMLVQLLSLKKIFWEKDELPKMFQRAFKHFCAGFAESGWLCDAFKDAARIEAVLGTGMQRTVWVEVYFYKRGFKQAHYELRFHIDSNGDIAGGVCVGIRKVA